MRRSFFSRELLSLPRFLAPRARATNPKVYVTCRRRGRSVRKFVRALVVSRQTMIRPQDGMDLARATRLLPKANFVVVYRASVRSRSHRPSSKKNRAHRTPKGSTICRSSKCGTADLKFRSVAHAPAKMRSQVARVVGVAGRTTSFPLASCTMATRFVLKVGMAPAKCSTSSLTTPANVHHAVVTNRQVARVKSDGELSTSRHVPRKTLLVRSTQA